MMPCVIKVRSPEPSLDRLTDFNAERPSARIILSGSVAYEKPISDDESELFCERAQKKHYATSINIRPSRPPRRQKGDNISNYRQSSHGASNSSFDDLYLLNDVVPTT